MTRARVHTHTYMHVRTHIHTRTRAHSHARVHAQAQTHIIACAACRVSYLPFIWHLLEFLFAVMHTHPLLHWACCCLLEVSPVSLVVLAVRPALVFHCDTHACTHAQIKRQARMHKGRHGCSLPGNSYPSTQLFRVSTKVQKPCLA